MKTMTMTISRDHIDEICHELRNQAKLAKTNRRKSLQLLFDDAADLIEDLTTPVKANELSPGAVPDPSVVQRIVNDVRRNEQQSHQLTERFRDRAQRVIQLENENRELRRQLNRHKDKLEETCDSLHEALLSARELLIDD